MSTNNRKFPDVYLTAKDIETMADDELVGVSRIAINIRIMDLESRNNADKEAIEILMKASREIRDKEKKRKNIKLWGAKMSVQDVKKAFGNISEMSKTYFKKSQ